MSPAPSFPESEAHTMPVTLAPAGQVQACAARYAANNIFIVIELLKNVVGNSCAIQIARETEAAAMEFDAEHAQCMAKADGP